MLSASPGAMYKPTTMPSTSLTRDTGKAGGYIIYRKSLYILTYHSCWVAVDFQVEALTQGNHYFPLYSYFFVCFFLFFGLRKISGSIFQNQLSAATPTE